MEELRPCPYVPKFNHINIVSQGQKENFFKRPYVKEFVLGEIKLKAKRISKPSAPGLSLSWAVSFSFLFQGLFHLNTLLVCMVYFHNIKSLEPSSKLKQYLIQTRIPISANKYLVFYFSFSNSQYLPVRLLFNKAPILILEPLGNQTKLP